MNRPLKLYFQNQENYLNKSLDNFYQNYPIDQPFDYIFRDTTDKGKPFFEPSSPEEADYFIAQQHWRCDGDNNKAFVFFDKAREYGKKGVLLYYCDHYEPIDHKHALVLRASIYKSTLKDNELPLTCFSEDLPLSHNNGQITIREKKDKPLVGFCGDATYSKPKPGLINKIKYLHQKIRYEMIANIPLEKKLSQIGIHLTKKPGSKARAQTIIPLSKSNKVNTHFIIRDKNNNGALFNGTPEDNALIKKSKREFYDNINNTDYTLCSRGNGNFSWRLYETLSCGRIPIFINTDCVLPFEDYIDWKKHCVWVEEDELPILENKILEFHNSLTPNAFKELQHANRKLWEDWFHIRNAAKNLSKLLKI